MHLTRNLGPGIGVLDKNLVRVPISSSQFVELQIRPLLASHGESRHTVAGELRIGSHRRRERPHRFLCDADAATAPAVATSPVLCIRNPWMGGGVKKVWRFSPQDPALLATSGVGGSC
jgi:hypothetical protein